MSKIILIILFCILVVVAISKTKKANLILGIVIVLTLVVIITFRDTTMADYKVYADIYNYELESVEPFHIILIRYLKTGGFTIITYFFLVATLTVVIQYNAIKVMMPKLWALSVITWLGTSFILNDMVTIRAGLAAALLLWMVYYRVNGQFFKLILIFLLTLSSHISSAVFIIIFVISPIKPHKILYLLCLCCSILCPIIGFSLTDFIGAVGIDLFDEKMQIYLNDSEANVLSLFQILKFLISITLWLVSSRVIPHNKYFLLALKVYTIGCIWFFATYKIMAIAWRISCLFWTADVLIYPFLAYIISKKISPKSKLIPAGICTVLFIVNLNMQQYWNPI